jgi:hypothetical protein
MLSAEGPPVLHHAWGAPLVSEDQPNATMTTDPFQPEPTMQAILKIRLERDLGRRTLELQTCSKHERAARVRQALQLQMALMAFEKRAFALINVPSADGFVNEDEVFIAVC